MSKKKPPASVAIPLPLHGLEIICPRALLDEKHNYHVVLVGLLQETIQAIALQSEAGTKHQNMESFVRFWFAERTSDGDGTLIKELLEGAADMIYGNDASSFAVIREYLFERCADLEADRLIAVARKASS